MSGCLQQQWVSYAGEDGEVLKCLMLARALKRSLTTRPLTVIVSMDLSKDLILGLQREVGSVFWAEPVPGLFFRSVAKRIATKLCAVHKIVFLDCACLPLKNCDDLFRSHGVQWVGEAVAAIVVKSRSLGTEEQQLIIELVVERENPGKLIVNNSKGITLDEITYCVKIEMKSSHPSLLAGDDVKMVCFVNGHPHDDDVFCIEERGLLTVEVFKLCIALCPELYPKAVKGSGMSVPLLHVPWELHNSIAIVGMACRYPGANSIAELWSLLEGGLDGIRKVPEGRWTKENAFIRMDNVGTVDAGFLSCPVDTFDAKFFNTNAADLHYLDPQQRLSLRVVWEALEHAGIDPNILKKSLTGVFGGWWRSEHKEMLQTLDNTPDGDFIRAYMGSGLGPVTARISHFFELMGPSFSTESGCSTAVAGVDMACDSLRNDACDLAIAVAANLILSPFNASAMEGVLATNGRCKTFDSSADGFGRAEGIGVLILKRFSNAVANGDRIWGLIRGSAIVQEGPSFSMGTPTVEVEAKAMSLALERAGVDPNDVEFVETHGTGTPVGDPIEILAVAKAYSGIKGRNNVLTIGSVKTNIGHTESVCGIASIQKSVLAMEHELIPKHLHFKNLNPDINLDAIPAQLPLEAMPWKRRQGGKPRIAGINSFGITGAQAHLLVQEPPENIPPHCFTFTDSRTLRMLTFSAKTEEAFLVQVNAYTAILKEGSVSLKDIEYTMHTGRPHMLRRQIALGSTKEELLRSMEGIKGKPIPNTQPKLCFLFTGQGSQYPGMAKSLYEQSLVFKTNFDWCESVLDKEYGFSLRSALWDDEHDSLLKSSLYSQTSIFVVEFCLLRLWESWGVKPDAVLGHSLGEFAAAVAADIISPEDAIKLVVTRSKLINALPTASMIAVGANLKDAEESLDRGFINQKQWLDVAAVNSESQTVLAGATAVVNEFKEYCENNKIKAHVLDASHAFHSRLMDPMLKEYEQVAATMKFKEPKKSCTFISGVDGRVVYKLDAGYWVRHTREEVQFLNASHAAIKEEQSLFLEIGPHPVLSTLLATNVEELADVITTPSIRKKSDDWETMLTSLGKLYSLGRAINWENFHRYSGTRKVELPGYHFEETLHWMSIKDDGTAPFHPLLGSFVPNPSGVTIFKSIINVHRLPFLKDHSLGDKIIFPCVGYVDMLMTGGYAATLCSEGAYVKPTSPMGVKNFSIECPICLSEIQPTEFQVVVSKTSDGETCGTLFTKVFLENSSFRWVRNATGTFDNSPASPPEVVKGDFQAIKARCSETVLANVDYEKLREFGFNFGASIRTISSAWRNPNDTDEWIFPFSIHVPTDDSERFIAHPWALDAMLQAQTIASGLLHDEQARKDLVVPISIETFTWWSHSAPKGYVYIKNNLQGNEAHLFDDDGKLMASMMGTEFMETTLSSILALIESQRNPYPSLAEYIWREELGPEERRVPDSERWSISLQQFVDTSKAFNRLTLNEIGHYEREHALGGLYILKAVKELGLDTYREFRWPQIANKLSVLPSMDKFLRYLLLELVKDGWLDHNGGDKFKLRKELPKQNQIRTQLDSSLAEFRTNEVVNLTVDMDSVATVSEKLSEILTGKQSAHALVFPEGINVVGPAEKYHTASLFITKRQSMTYIDAEIFTQLSHMGTKSVVRVLEVASGAGNCTSDLIGHMTTAGVTHFEYTYTAITPTLLQKGEALFAETGIAAKFPLLNVEKDPLGQGFIPGHYDVIVTCWVLHATKSIQKSLLNIKKLLKPGGYVLMTEFATPTRPINLLHGGLENYWGFEDTDLRPWNCELSIPKWDKLLQDCGFQDVVTLPICNETNALVIAKLGPNLKKVSATPNETGKLNTWVIYGNKDDMYCNELVHRLEATNHHVILVTRDQITGSSIQMEKKIRIFFEATMGDTKIQLHGVAYLLGLDVKLSTQSVCEPFLYICKNLAKTSVRKVTILTQGNLSTGASDYFQSAPTAAPLVGMLNVLSNENPDLTCKIVDLDGNPALTRKAAIAEAFTELFTTGNDVMVAYRKGQRCIPNLRPYNVKTAPISIPRTPRFRLLLPPTHFINDLRFVVCQPERVGEREVEVQVKVYALNFLDVLMVTKPDPVFEKYNYVGIDIAGVISAVGANVKERKVGDRVVVARNSGIAMPSHVVVPDNHTMVIPADLTDTEASTFPLGMLTIDSCLIEAAQARKDDVVLIHTASGAVGLLGIQVAKRLGCTIVVTAGNERKRNYLRSLGLTHVFNSRTTEYKSEIRTALGGRGVDIVLNSLTGEGFKEATLEVCETNARFIEMSKMNIWTKEQVKYLRPDIYYEVVDVSSHSDRKLADVAENIQKQLNRSVGDRPTPIPCIRFDAAEIREALEYMEKVKHVGKIVLVMPEQEMNKPAIGAGGTEPVSLLFNGISTYLITGGLGGIGLEVANWMGSLGAKTVLLVGRSQPKPGVLEKIKKLRGAGVQVEVRQCDVGDLAQVEKLKAEFESGSLPPLRGIMHAAGVLDDGVYENQTWEKYSSVFRCKVDGGWNLHHLSTQLPFPLEHFVVFSSITATIGSPGQSNYVAANQYLDALVHYRNSIGLPGTSINWGQWGQVGLAASMVIPFNKPFTIDQGLAALQHIIKSHKTQVAAHETDLSGIKQMFMSTKGLLAETEDDSSQGSNEIDGQGFWKDYDGTKERNEKFEVVRKFLKKLIRMTLRMDKNEDIDDNINLQDMGMDSLLMVEMKNGLQASMGKRVKISMNAMKDCRTVKQLSDRLVELISGKEKLPLTADELGALVARDAKLPENIRLGATLSSTLCPLSKVSTVLLIGCTGTLGPYILRELSKRLYIKQIYCLMQEALGYSPSDRFRDVYKKKGLFSEICFEKIKCIPGDVRESCLGLSESMYTKLLSEVDAVFNLAVKFGLDENYCDTEDPNSCRIINVVGMRNVLSFAIEKKLKYVFHPSTLSAAAALDKDGSLFEGWPKEEEIFLIPNSDYSISKLISDRLVEQAVAVGVPCKVFRFPQIGGDSIRGGNFQMNSLFMIRCLSYLYTENMHRLPTPVSLMAVDQCAKLSVDLFFNEKAGYEMFNVLNPHLGDEFDSLGREFGINVNILGTEEFMDMWKEIDSTDETVQLVRDAMTKDANILQELPYYKSWREGNKHVFYSKKMKQLVPGYPSCITKSWDVLKKDLRFAMDSGIFERYNIKH